MVMFQSCLFVSVSQKFLMVTNSNTIKPSIITIYLTTNLNLVHTFNEIVQILIYVIDIVTKYEYVVDNHMKLLYYDDHCSPILFWGCLFQLMNLLCLSFFSHAFFRSIDVFFYHLYKIGFFRHHDGIISHLKELMS